ncbi:MAG: M18 family aminopeptidase [Candidatus Delongbacteria bacterium]|jgi:aspartyl aminopeptidase|nr:M18 family aminopeptidase [Candidatus Delongbacteria bacterium]
MNKKEMLKIAKDLNNFIDRSPTSSHCVIESEEILKKAGYKKIDEAKKWNLKAGDKFYIIRHETSLVAGVIGNKKPNISGFRMIGSHTDSPAIKLKPNSLYTKGGCVQLATEIYGGPIFASWMDKDLSLAGRVIVKKGKSYEVKLVDLDKLIFNIPQLAIHYNSDVNKAYNINPQEHLVPVIGLSEEKLTDEWLKDQIASKLKVKSSEIINYDMEIYPVQKGVISGFNSDFIVNRNIDNKSMVHASIKAILDTKPSDSTQIIALYDNEEVGSSTTNGGNSTLTADILERLSGSREDYFRAIAVSYYMSADGAHAFHPNYGGKFDANNTVYLNKGPVIKVNANTRYATTAESSSVFEMVCKKKKIPYQKFVNRSDVRGGGTIGSMIATNIGVRTVDVGTALWAMHSTRETCGVEDHANMIQAMNGFLEY